MSNSFYRPRGYIAIVSAIILSAILTAITITESTGVFWARFSQLDAIHRTQSLELAHSCVFAAVAAYAENPDTSTPNTLTLEPGSHCTFSKIVVTASGATLYVQNAISGAQVTLAVSVTQNQNMTNSLTIQSVQEVTSIPP